MHLTSLCCSRVPTIPAQDNNAYVHKMMDWKTKYDESDNAVLRASKLLTEKVGDIMGGLFQRTELSEVSRAGLLVLPAVSAAPLDFW